LIAVPSTLFSQSVIVVDWHVFANMSRILEEFRARSSLFRRLILSVHEMKVGVTKRDRS
jgi:hypothetical protein